MKKKHHHPTSLTPEEREEWHKLCNRIAELYGKMPGGDDGLTSIIIFKRSSFDYIDIKHNNMRIDFNE